MTTTISTNQLKDLIQYRLPEYQALALDIHEHPEVSNYEFYSSAALIKQLEKEINAGIEELEKMDSVKFHMKK